MLLREYVNFKTSDKKVLSYGPCQFPTLGFIVERYQEIENFVPEDFWYLKLSVERQQKDRKLTCDFKWVRDRLFDKSVCQMLLLNCKDAGQARVISVIRKPTKKIRP